MGCSHTNFDTNQPHTLREWFEFWEIHKYQDPTRNAAISMCFGDKDKLKALEWGAFHTYVERKAAKSLVVDPLSLKIRSACLVHNVGVKWV